MCAACILSSIFVICILALACLVYLRPWRKGHCIPSAGQWNSAWFHDVTPRKIFTYVSQIELFECIQNYQHVRWLNELYLKVHHGGFFSFLALGGMRLNPHDLRPIFGPFYQLWIDRCGPEEGMRICMGKRRTRRKHASVPLCLP